ncbi:hypothetical protein JB92DRAFT_2705083 [Gautieria morchelliformis]|nr:hypothetical protein JB92DRAFT_2705083 [Gautieria morchelliformis]
MGKATKALKAFIDGVPDSKLTGLPMTATKLYTDTNFRLDMQGVQVNNGTSISTLKTIAPDTVAHCLAPVDPAWTADEVRQALKDGTLI